MTKTTNEFQSFLKDFKARTKMSTPDIALKCFLSTSLLEKVSGGANYTAETHKKLWQNLDLTAKEFKTLQKIRVNQINKDIRVKKKTTHFTLKIKPLAAKIAYECTGSIAGACIWLEATPATVKTLLLQHEMESNGRIS